MTGIEGRSSNIELYRILVMLLIIAHHYVVNSGLVSVVQQNATDSNALFFLLFGAWGKTGINCFVMITGYFMCKSSITLRKFLKLALWILTYRIIVLVAFGMADYHPLGRFTLIKPLIALRHISLNFEDCYLLFFLFIPFINILIKNLTKQQHLFLIGLTIFVYVLHGSLPGFSITMNYISWFSCVYLFGSYFRLYKLTNDTNVSFWLKWTIISWSLSICSVVFLYMCYNHIHIPLSIQNCYLLVHDSNSILAVTNALTSFMLFKNLKIKNNRIINLIAASSFGVFLIHTCGETMRYWLWNDVIDCEGHYDTPFYWGYAIFCVCAIYSLCAIIDLIRRYTIEAPLLNMTESILKCLCCKCLSLIRLNNE